MLFAAVPAAGRPHAPLAPVAFPALRSPLLRWGYAPLGTACCAGYWALSTVHGIGTAHPGALRECRKRRPETDARSGFGAGVRLVGLGTPSPLRTIPLSIAAPICYFCHRFPRHPLNP